MSTEWFCFCTFSCTRADQIGAGSTYCPAESLRGTYASIAVRAIEYRCHKILPVRFGCPHNIYFIHSVYDCFERLARYNSLLIASSNLPSNTKFAQFGLDPSPMLYSRAAGP
jgi:hypothetical protein